jgi:hypothetical protein
MKKFFSFLVLILKWVVKSSKDVNQWSLTLKGILLSMIPIILIITESYKVNLSSESLTSIINEIIALIIVICGGIATIATAFGSFRKIVTTFQGSNDVINSSK